MCKQCEAKVNGFKMKKRREIRGLDTAGILRTGTGMVAAYGGYALADLATQKVDFLNENDVTDGAVKISTAIGLSMIPTLANSELAMSAVLGWGVHGIKKLVNSFAPDGKPYVNGYDGSNWDNYDRNADMADNRRM